MRWYVLGLKKYAVFKGRSRRKEFWMFALYSTIFAFLSVFLDSNIGFSKKTYGFGALSPVYFTLVLLPSWGVTIRRLHDVGKSGWFLSIVLLPVIGFVWLIVLLCTDTEPRKNRYGRSPKRFFYIL